MTNDGNEMATIAENGSVVPVAPAIENNGFALGSNPNNSFVFDRANRTVSFATADGGTVEIRQGTMIAFSFANNVEDFWPEFMTQNASLDGQVRTVNEILEDAKNGVAGQRSYLYDIEVVVPR